MPLCTSYFPNYFSVDDILATQEKMPCKFQVPVHRMGFLDPSSDSQDIMVGLKLELPYWLVKSLCNRQRQVVSADVPKIYKEGYREILQADASIVDLHKLCPYFYEFGMYLQNFENREAAFISDTLIQTFKCRFRKIMDSSQNILHEDNSQLTEKLDTLELGLFHAGQQGLINYQKWLTRQTGQIVTAEMVNNHRKRKHAALEKSC